MTPLCWQQNEVWTKDVSERQGEEEENTNQIAGIGGTPPERRRRRPWLTTPSLIGGHTLDPHLYGNTKKRETPQKFFRI